MKSNYIANKSESRKIAWEIAKEEIERQKENVCPNCQQSIGNQVAAVMLKALHDNFGFGKERICRLIDCTESLFELCAKDGKKYKATDCIEWLRDAMGIDLERDTK